MGAAWQEACQEALLQEAAPAGEMILGVGGLEGGKESSNEDLVECRRMKKKHKESQAIRKEAKAP